MGFAASYELIEELKSLEKIRNELQPMIFKKESKKLLQRWLDQEIPYLHDQVLKFLCIDGSFKPYNRRYRNIRAVYNQTDRTKY